MTLTGTTSTKNAGQYMMQLCKHWSHKFETAHTQTTGVVALPFGRTDFVVEGETLRITVAHTTDTERAKSVITDHLNRFAFREGPLAITWSTTP